MFDYFRDIYQSLSQFIAGKTDEYKNLLNTAIDGLTAVGSIIPKDSKLTRPLPVLALLNEMKQKIMINCVITQWLY